MKVGSLFSGIGGMDLGLERAGHEIVWQVEIDDWCRRVLSRHWPDVAKFADVKDLTGDELEAVDLICGGFPCQPVSVAGKRLAQADERWLWPEFHRIIRLLRPRFVLVENVPGLLARGLGDVLGDLAASGYDAEWDCIPAATFGAPHLRYRVFIVAHAQCSELRDESRRRNGPRGAGASVARDDGAAGDVADPHGGRREGSGQSQSRREQGSRGRLPNRRGEVRKLLDSPVERSGHWATEPDVGRVAHGVPSRVDRLRGLGNAVVPQVAEWIGRRLMEVS